MATVYKCDRCGHETKEYTDHKTVSLPRDFDYPYIGDSSETKHDLCLSCLRHIRQEIASIPRLGGNKC